MTEKTIFICADHGLAIVYFLQTDVIQTILNAGIKVILLTDDGLADEINRKFSRNGLSVEGLRFRQCKEFFETHQHNLQYWLHFLRWMGGSSKI